MIIVNWHKGGQQRFVQRLNVNRRAPLRALDAVQTNLFTRSSRTNMRNAIGMPPTPTSEDVCKMAAKREKKKKSEPTSSLCSESVSVEAIVVEVVDAAVLFAFGIRPNINEVALSALAYATTPVMARIQITKDSREFSGFQTIACVSIITEIRLCLNHISF